MLDWILILTVMYGGDSAYIHSIEFSSNKTCMAAGQLWLKTKEIREDEGRTMPYKSAICVLR